MKGGDGGSKKGSPKILALAGGKAKVKIINREFPPLILVDYGKPPSRAQRVSNVRADGGSDSDQAVSNDYDDDDEIDDGQAAIASLVASDPVAHRQFSESFDGDDDSIFPSFVRDDEHDHHFVLLPLA